MHAGLEDEYNREQVVQRCPVLVSIFCFDTAMYHAYKHH